MSDIKFSCPACGQHLSGDVRYAGSQITCPQCRQPFTVPGMPESVAPPPPPSPPPPPPASGVRGPAVLARAATAPPPPPPPARPVPAPRSGPVAQKTSGLAMASLICSCASILIGFFGAIPGIICGHMARARFKKDPSLGGRGLATAGLIVGYSLLAISTIVIGAMIAAFVGGIRKGMEQAARPGGGGRVRVERSASVKPAAIDATPDGSGWTLKLEGVGIPSSPVTGRIHGSPFTAEQTRTQGGWITLRQGADFFPDLEFSVVLFENNLNQLAGRTFTVPGGQGTTPHIWMKWKEAGENMPKQTSFTKDYAMRLEFGPMSNGKLPGKIYLCVPDEQKSYMRGTFEIDTQAKAGRPATGSPRPRPGTGRPGQGKGATP